MIASHQVTPLKDESPRKHLDVAFESIGLKVSPIIFAVGVGHI